MSGLKMGGLHTVGSHLIKVKENVPVYLIPFGDVHFGAPQHTASRWLRFIQKRIDCPNTYYLGMGDYVDFASTSEKRAMRDLHESTIDLLEAMSMDLLTRFAETIEHARGKLLGFVQGNHDPEFIGGDTGTMRLAKMFKTEYMGCSTFRRLRFQSSNTMESSIDILAHHGQGGGARLKGGSLNRVQYMAESAIADIYLMGHDHQRSVAPDTRLVLRHNKAGIQQVERQAWYARTGSFLKAYEPGSCGYIADGAKKPSDIGGVTFQFVLTRRTVDGQRTLQIETEATL